jgi:hypothetical protein
MAKTIRVECPPALQEILCVAIREYAEAAYPPGGSECGQAARQALMDAAEKLETDFVANNGVYAELSRRLRTHLKSASQYYVEQHQCQELEPLLRRLLEGEVIGHAELSSSCHINR